jgi:preprotein translocase subunit SecY
MLFPQLFAQLISVFSVNLSVSLQSFVNTLLNNQGIYAALYFVLVVAFTYFYTSITFNPGEIAKNLQQSGGFVPGIRPGTETEKYLGMTMNRLNLIGAFFLGIIAILPLLVQGFAGSQNLTIGGTSLLIVVSVAIESAKQIDSQITMHEYDHV